MLWVEVEIWEKKEERTGMKSQDSGRESEKKPYLQYNGILPIALKPNRESLSLFHIFHLEWDLRKRRRFDCGQNDSEIHMIDKKISIQNVQKLKWWIMNGSFVRSFGLWYVFVLLTYIITTAAKVPGVVLFLWKEKAKMKKNEFVQYFEFSEI